MGTILVPTDFSESSDKSTDFSAKLSEKLKSHMLLLYVEKKKGKNRETGMGMGMEQEKEATKQLQLISREIKEKNNIVCSYDIRSGNCAEEILNETARVNAELIVMGAKGAGNIERMILGSNTEKVVSQAHTPVMIVPDSVSGKPIKNILLAVGASPPDIHLLRKISQFASGFNAKILVTHVSKEKTGLSCDATISMIRATGFKNISCEVLSGKDIAAQLKKLIRDKKSDLLMMVRKEKPVVRDLFSLDLTRAMAFSVDIPVMIYYETLLGPGFTDIYSGEILG